MASDNVVLRSLEFDQVENALQQLPGRIAGRVLRSALRFAANAIQKEAKNILKNDGHSVETQRGVIVRTRRSGRYTVRVAVGYSRDQAHLNFLEQGTGPHTIEPRRSSTKVLGYKRQDGTWPAWTAASVDHPGMSPQPWLRPAFVKTKDEVIQRFGEKVWERIDIEARKLRGSSSRSG